MMAKDSVRRKTFIDSVVPFLQLYGFEGLDFDWEYPGDREGSDPDNDKENFSILVSVL
jgi:chitinase